LPEMGDPGRLEHVAHGAEHGAQPPDGGAHLVNLLGVPAESNAGLGVPQRVDLLAQERDDALPGFTAGGDRNLLDGLFRRHYAQHRTVREKSRRISTARRAVALAPAGSYNRSMASLTPERKTALRREMESLLGKGAVLSAPDELLVYESAARTPSRCPARWPTSWSSPRPPSTWPPSSASPTARACPSWPAAPAPGSPAAACRRKAASSSR